MELPTELYAGIQAVFLTGEQRRILKDLCYFAIKQFYEHRDTCPEASEYMNVMRQIQAELMK